MAVAKVRVVLAFIAMAVFTSLTGGVSAAESGTLRENAPDTIVTLWTSWQGADGLRPGQATPYGLADNTDYAVQGSIGCEGPAVQVGSNCSVALQYRGSDDPVDIGDPNPKQGSFRYERDGFVVETITMPAWQLFTLSGINYPDPGTFTERWTAIVDGVEVESWTNQITVVQTPPTVPTNGAFTATDDGFRIEWSAPANDGGSPVTGYMLELLEANPDWPGASPDRWLSEQVACNFEGRPELRACDAPNNQLTVIEPGEYRWRLRAMNAIDLGSNAGWIGVLPALWMSDSFDVSETLGTLPEPPAVTTTTTTTTTAPTTTTQPTTTTTAPTTTTTTSRPAPTVTVAPAGPSGFWTPPADIPTSYEAADSIAGIVSAPDYVNTLDAPVLRLYQAYFNRRPDLGGAKYWLGVRRQGFDLLAIAGFMSGSTEFATNYAGTSNAEYVGRVYTNVLGRGYDQDGYDYWLDLLDRGPDREGLDRPETVFWMVAGVEFINNHPYTTKPR